MVLEIKTDVSYNKLRSPFLTNCHQFFLIEKMYKHVHDFMSKSMSFLIKY